MIPHATDLGEAPDCVGTKVALGVSRVHLDVQLAVWAGAAALPLRDRVCPPLPQPGVVFDAVEVGPSARLVDGAQHLGLDGVLLAVDDAVLGAALEAARDAEVDVNVRDAVLVLVLLGGLVESNDRDELELELNLDNYWHIFRGAHEHSGPVHTCRFHQGRPCRARNSSNPSHSFVATTHSPVMFASVTEFGAAIFFSVPEVVGSF
jgi:hypothetical protein